MQPKQKKYFTEIYLKTKKKFGIRIMLNENVLT